MYIDIIGSYVLPY